MAHAPGFWVKAGNLGVNFWAISQDVNEMTARLTQVYRKMRNNKRAMKNRIPGQSCINACLAK
jgi:hypothetical protein